MKKIIIKNRIIKPEDFIDKRFKPSLQTKSNFIKLFDRIYPKFFKYINIKSLEWNRNEFLIMLIENKSWEILHLNLKDNFWIKKCKGLLCTNNICTWIHYEINNEYFLKFLVYFIVKWIDFKLNNFLQILTKDLKAKKEYYQIFWKQNRPPFSIIQDWWHPLQKYRFLVHEWIMRNMDQSIRLSLSEASIHHSERECQWISPNNKATWYHFFNFPGWYYDHRFDKYYYLTKEEKEKYIYWINEWQWMWISTDLDENDIVMWKWIDKLSRALDYVAENIKKNNIKMLSFNCCCVPRIIWDDIYSVLKRAKKKIKVPFVFQWQLEKTPYEQKIMLLEEYINKIDITKIKKVNNSISLFWYHENIFQKDLWDILVNNWIKINTSFIPTIDVRLLELMYKSELFIFSPNNFQKEVFEYPFQEIWTKFISPKYPYWIKNTDNWLKSIWNHFDININLDDKNTKIIKQYNKNVRIVKQNKYSIWIPLLWLQEIKKLFSTDYMNNINIVQFLEEMWFKIILFVFDDFKFFMNRNDDSYKISDWNHDKIEEIILKNIEDKNNVNINYFSAKDNFDLLLKESNLDLIHSDLYFDNRVINLWLNQISLKNFNAWYSWSLKTIKELKNLCEMNFYKNYSKYFTK